MFKLYHLAMEGDNDAQKTLNELDDLTHYGLDRGKKIVMYIRLYFPALSRIHQMLFASEHELNMLRYEVRSPNPPEAEDLLVAGGKVGHFLRLMEQEIVDNRDVLLKANWLPRWYRSATQKQIDNPIPQPDGPYIHDERLAKSLANKPQDGLEPRA